MKQMIFAVIETVNGEVQGANFFTSYELAIACKAKWMKENKGVKNMEVTIMSDYLKSI